MDYCTAMEQCLFIFTVYHHLTSAATHSLQYFYTGVTPGIDFPEFTAVGLVDEDQIMYYDSNIRKVMQRNDWIKKSNAQEPEYWNIQTQRAQGTQDIFKVNMDILMKRLNQTKGVHTVQRMYGCELDDNGTRRGYMQYGYDGEDFLSLDLNTLTWTAANAKAVITKRSLEKTETARFLEAYLLRECIGWLKKYVEYGRSTLERKVPPEVSLFQKNSSSPVVCHATGFYPKPVMISWKKNGEDLDENVEIRETTCNQDRTFQARSILTVSPEELDKHNYTCIIQHSEKEMVLLVSDRRVLSGGGSVGINLGQILLVSLLIVIVLVRVCVWKMMKPAS